MNDWPHDYFDWMWWRFAWASAPHWNTVPFDDGSIYVRVFLGLYWRAKD